MIDRFATVFLLTDRGSSRSASRLSLLGISFQDLKILGSWESCWDLGNLPNNLGNFRRSGNLKIQRCGCCVSMLSRWL